MNQSILMGRLTRDPEVRYSSGEDAIAIANFRMAVDRPFVRKDDEEKADFFSCTAFGKRAEFVEDYLRKGVKVLVTGRLQNDNYTNRDGDKVYAMKIIVNNIEFAESKAASDANRGSMGMGGGYQQSAPSPAPMPSPMGAAGDGFMNIPDGIDEELPFN